MRKLWFGHLARAIVAFPGGFGTMDELFEMLTLSQTGKLDRPIRVLLYGPGYWDEVVDFQAFVRHGMIAEKDLSLFQTVDDPQTALALLQEAVPEEVDTERPCFAKSNTLDHPGPPIGPR
jgi:uncharacterized protein (TIGR00730 family)